MELALMRPAKTKYINVDSTYLCSVRQPCLTGGPRNFCPMSCLSGLPSLLNSEKDVGKTADDRRKVHNASTYTYCVQRLDVLDKAALCDIARHNQISEHTDRHLRAKAKQEMSFKELLLQTSKKLQPQTSTSKKKKFIRPFLIKLSYSDMICFL